MKSVVTCAIWFSASLAGCGGRIDTSSASNAQPAASATHEADAGARLPTTGNNAGGAASPPTPAGPTAAWRIEGRYVQDPAGPKLTWPGTKMTFRFAGPSITVTYLDNTIYGSDFPTYLEASVDGVLQTPPIPLPGDRVSFMNTTVKSFTVQAGSAGVHTVVLQKRTEEMNGVTQILGFDKPLLALPPDTRTRKMEFIGDSLTAGYGIENETGTVYDSSVTSSETPTYGALTAARFKAQHHCIAASGRGLVQDATGKAPGGTMVDRFLRVQDGGDHPYTDGAPPLHLTALWDFKQWQADVVTINLGTNDFTYGPIAIRAPFASFFRLVRAEYPDARIIAILGSQLTDPRRADLRTQLQGAISDVADPKLSFLEFPRAPIEDGFGGAGHPNRLTHFKQSLLLIEEVKRVTGWD